MCVPRCPHGVQRVTLSSLSLPVDPMVKSWLGFGQKILVRRQGELFLPGLGALHLQASVCRARVEGNQDLTTQDRAGLPLGNGCQDDQTFGTRSLCSLGAGRWGAPGQGLHLWGTQSGWDPELPPMT